jgi:hypothetical protein
MLCARVSLLTNTTRVPGAMVRDVGLVPFAVIVIVRPAAGGSEGVEGDPDPPQEADRVAIIRRASARNTLALCTEDAMRRLRSPPFPATQRAVRSKAAGPVVLHPRACPGRAPSAEPASLIPDPDSYRMTIVPCRLAVPLFR